MLRLLDLLVAYCEINLRLIGIDCVWLSPMQPLCTICPERAEMINKTTNTENNENEKRLIEQNEKSQTHQHKVVYDEHTIDGNDNKMLW